MPPPVPPSVNAGRMMTGNGQSFPSRRGLRPGCARCRKSGTSRPMEIIRSLKTCRSSPRSMASALAPIISMPYFSSTPLWCKAIAVLSAVWPPSVGAERVCPFAPELVLHLLHFAHDDFLDAFGRDGFDVGAVGELRVGHDGGRVGVDEHDAEALLLSALQACVPE